MHENLAFGLEEVQKFGAGGGQSLVEVGDYGKTRQSHRVSAWRGVFDGF
jgi:hypothetical protein